MDLIELITITVEPAFELSDFFSTGRVLLSSTVIAFLDGGLVHRKSTKGL